MVDYANNRVQKFSSDGSFLDRWGSFGAGKGQFLSPSFIAADSSGHVYVADSGNSRIQKFSSSGKCLDQWDSPGPGAGVPDYPQGIATDSSGNVFVVGTNSIQKRSPRGALLTRWGRFGKSNGQFRSLQGITTDSSGNIYVGDSGNSRIQKFHDSGPPYPDPGTARLKVPRPWTVTIRGGRTGKVAFKVKNTGSNTVKKVKVCMPLSANARKAIKHVGCVQLGSIGAGKRKKGRLRIRTKCKSGRTLKPKVKANAANADPVGTRVRIRLTDCRPGPRPPLPEVGLGTKSASGRPSPPRLPRDFTGKGRYFTPDLGIDVPFSFRGSNGNVKMVAGGKHDPIWFMNIIYGKPGEAKRLYTVTYRWPGLVSRDPCSPIATFSRTDLNSLLARSSFVGKEILLGNPRRQVNHWRMTTVFPPMPPGKFVRLPIVLADVYVDQGKPSTFRKVLHFGFQNLYDPELDEWFEMDNFRHKPGKVTLPEGC